MANMRNFIKIEQIIPHVGLKYNNGNKIPIKYDIKSFVKGFWYLPYQVSSTTRGINPPRQSTETRSHGKEDIY
jgi:hypothetical protein